ncbi:hypothetical protein OH77DRAFT_1023116 [Trametes cingulata]|nr:hypothetical protein OH77DRAFT_1023116 [Trametes cingulata]
MRHRLTTRAQSHRSCVEGEEPYQPATNSSVRRPRSCPLSSRERTWPLACPSPTGRAQAPMSEARSSQRHRAEPRGRSHTPQDEPHEASPVTFGSNTRYGRQSTLAPPGRASLLWGCWDPSETSRSAARLSADCDSYPLTPPFSTFST